LRLRELVSPVTKEYVPNPGGSFVRPGAATIYRSNGKRMIAIKFSVRGRDLGSAVAEAKAKLQQLWQIPYHPEWSGEFEQMEDANARLMWMIPLSLALIMAMQYYHFRSVIDTIVIMTNVFDVFVGGIWSLYLTGTNFSVSAAVGFHALFGIAHMEGLLLIGYFNALRAQGLPLQEAIIQGSLKRVRPVMITALTAILGLLPAAVSTKIGGQTAQPLAIVIVGGMTVTLFLDRYLMPVLYSFYGHREPPEGSGTLVH
ncbi:MAG: efflux RND transporter permease subunit, partial [Planctomycetaceae bacterium]|nr:efflux RND transporter permease subunit [Planctomycetaceae bacterium]